MVSRKHTNYIIIFVENKEDLTNMTRELKKMNMSDVILKYNKTY